MGAEVAHRYDITTIGATTSLHRDIEADWVQLVRGQALRGPAFDALRDYLWAYAMPVLRHALRTGRIVAMCRTHGVDVSMSIDDRQAMHTSPAERDALAVDTVLAGERYFTANALRKRRWDPARGSGLRTFFVGSCLIKFPDVYALWSRKRSDRLVEFQYGVALVPGLDIASGDNPETIAVQRDLVARLFEMARPTARAILTLMLRGLTYAEIAEELGLSERAVEGQIYRLRKAAAFVGAMDEADVTRMRSAS